MFWIPVVHPHSAGRATNQIDPCGPAARSAPINPVGSGNVLKVPASMTHPRWFALLSVNQRSHSIQKLYGQGECSAFRRSGLPHLERWPRTARAGFRDPWKFDACQGVTRFNFFAGPNENITSTFVDGLKHVQVSTAFGRPSDCTLQVERRTFVASAPLREECEDRPQFIDRRWREVHIEGAEKNELIAFSSTRSKANIRHYRQ